MARLFSSGFELNSNTNSVEWTSVTGSPTISTTTVRTGTYAGRISSLTSATVMGWLYQFKSASNAGPFYVRFYFRYATLPSAENKICTLTASTNMATVIPLATITIDNTGVLTLRDDFNTVAIGSPSSALNANTWYRIEMLLDSTGGVGARTIRARIDGTEFAASTTASTSNVLAAAFGGNIGGEAQTTGDWFFDDIAVNDNTGSFQTTYPGAGSIIHLYPDSAGDVNTWTIGTPAGGSNFQKVNEVTPDDGSSDIKSNTLNNEDLYNFGASGIGSGDTVNVVAVGVRFSNDTANATLGFKAEIEKTASGTKSQSAQIIPNSTTWKSNSLVVPRTPPIVLYQDPDASAWTQSTLDSLQAGVLLSAGSATNNILISTVWVTVDYTPAVVTAPTGYASWASTLIGQPYFSNDIVSV